MMLLQSAWTYFLQYINRLSINLLPSGRQYPFEAAADVASSATKTNEHLSLLAAASDAPVNSVVRYWPKGNNTSLIAVMNYRKLDPVLNEGQRWCAFTAVAMAASIVGVRLDVREMFEWARKMGFTHDGEIFDAWNLKTLCDKYLNNAIVDVADFPDKKSMMGDLLLGNVFLVPYDAATGSARPARLNGLEAQWALIFGSVLMLHNSYWFPANVDHLERLSAVKPIYRGDRDYHNDNARIGELLLLAQHGWYSEPDVWSFDTLHASCMQLTEMHPLYISRYNLLPEKIAQNLRGKVLRLDLRVSQVPSEL